MANQPGLKRLEARKGGGLSADDLNALSRQVARRIIGDGRTVKTRSFGDQVVISAIENVRRSVKLGYWTVPIPALGSTYPLTLSLSGGEYWTGFYSIDPTTIHDGYGVSLAPYGTYTRGYIYTAPSAVMTRCQTFFGYYDEDDTLLAYLASTGATLDTPVSSMTESAAYLLNVGHWYSDWEWLTGKQAVKFKVRAIIEATALPATITWAPMWVNEQGITAKLYMA